MIRFITTLFFILSACKFVVAQNHSGFYFRQFTTEEGLPSNGIKGLQWDKPTGFLWIATEAGIVRYNGLEFKTFGSADEPRITNERILFLVRNNTGNIFTADNSGNIFKVVKNKPVFVAKKYITGNPRSNITSISVSERLFNNLGDFRSPASFSQQLDKILPADDTSSFILHGGILYYLSETVRNPKTILSPETRFISAFKAGNDFFLTGPANEIYHMDPSTLKLTEKRIEFTGEQPGGQPGKNQFIWDNGMSYPLLINEEKSWKFYYQNGKLFADFITDRIPRDALIRYAQYDDEQQMLILGTDSKGIFIITKNRVESIRSEKPTGTRRTSYYSQLELPDGNILTNEGIVLGKNKKSSLSPHISGRFSTNTLNVGDSLLYYVQLNPGLRSSCLHRFNMRTGEIRIFEKIKEQLQLVMAVSGGHLYFANEKGIYRMESDSAVQVFSYPDDEKIRLHYDMKEIEPGVLAIANCNALLRFNIQSGRLDTLFHPGNYCVRTIWPYKDYIFFGTYGGGLFLYKQGKVISLPLDKNRHLLFTHCFVSDNGFCWISTNRGLFKASLDEMTDVYEKNNRDIYYYYFGKSDGMEMTELNGGCTPCALQMKNKTISFPSMDGLLWVKPELVKPVLPDGEIFIDEFKADSLLLNAELPGTIVLPSGTRDISLRLAFSAWCKKENIYFDYQLNDSLNWKPIIADKEALIQFSNLPSGAYTLGIRKRNGFGHKNYSYKTISFTISTPWYKMWWFNFLLLLGIAGLVLLYVRFRTRQLKQNQLRLEKLVAEKTRELQEKNEVLEKNDSIKTRLISIISHDIVTPLKFLTAAGKNLIHKRKVMSEELQKETLEEMANTSQELQLLSTNILNWIKYQNENRRLVKEQFNLHELVNHVFSILNSFARQKKLNLVNHVDKELLLYQYFEPLKILIYNLVTNAINFTEHGSIAVGAKGEQHHIEVFVKDEGAGMTPEQVLNITANPFIISSANMDKRKGHGLGYLIIKDLLKTMEGNLRIESEKGSGTMVIISLPLFPAR